MSIRVMTAVWDNGPTKQGHLLVMLALADYSNDHFECWPSMKSIASKARMTERGAQKILRTLEDEGWLFIQTGNGRHGCNQYRINASRLTPNNDHPEHGSPRTSMQKTPNVDAETPNGGSPEPSRTIKEPSESKKTPVDVLCQIVRHETATDFAAHRKAMKKPLTHEAARRLVSKLANHPDPDAVFDLSIENGWQGVFPEKIGGRNVHGNYNTTPDRPANRADPALEQIARLAGLNQASGNGGR